MNQETTETTPINSIQDLAECVMNWHQVKMARLEHLLQIPEGTVMQVDEESSVTLEDVALAAFKAGVMVSICELDELPFGSSESEEEPLPASMMGLDFEQVH